MFSNGIVKSYGEVADCIARRAYELGKDVNHKSPFAIGAAASGRAFNGGKHDDITITVAQIFRDDKEHERKAHSETFFTELVSVYHESPTTRDKHEEKAARVMKWDEL